TVASPIHTILCVGRVRWVEETGGLLVTLTTKNTRRTCPCCGHTAKDNRQTQAVFECVECSYTENADAVGAINVLKRGQAIQAA
ncbi:zinc ribbon domain-containing protein, partial [Neisseria cinerea]|uniref:zinc ribbon domain-containing protein n=1 Tax=Neisseria cinerea TaxID=483 RepID=UPI002B1D0E6A